MVPLRAVLGAMTRRLKLSCTEVDSSDAISWICPPLNWTLILDTNEMCFSASLLPDAPEGR